MDPNLSLRPGPSRRKSSNLLASLARQGTLSERDREHAHLDGISETGTMSSGLQAGSYNNMSSNASIMSSSTAATSSGMPTAPTAQNTPSSGSNFGVALENLRYLLHKRVTTFNYLKRAHEGRVHWFNTILLTREEMEAAFDNNRMQKRCGWLSMRYANASSRHMAGRSALPSWACLYLFCWTLLQRTISCGDCSAYCKSTIQ
jgi:hypothetical protein